MKKSLIVLLSVLLLWGTAEARIDVFYLPESGFLRVSGEVVIEPEAASVSFLIFPTAHLTEFWADGLVEYSVQRYPHSTAVSFAVREVQTQTVTFAYEGLVEAQLRAAVLGPDQLWLPQFTVPVQTSTVTLQLPENWEVVAGDIQAVEKQGAFQTIQLEPSSLYPTVELANTAEAPEPAEAGTDEAEPILPLEDQEPEPEREESAELDELGARIQIQINRFTRALNNRSLADLTELISADLQQEGLADYLASLPQYFGRISSAVLEVPADPNGAYVVLFSTERGTHYTAVMAWQETAGSLQLHEFRLVPQEAEVPPEIAESCAFFVRELQTALRAENRSRLETLLAPDLRQDPSEVMDFLFSLDSTGDWKIEQITLEPFTVTIPVPTAQGAKLLLQLDLTPGQYNWLLRGVQVVPLS